MIVPLKIVWIPNCYVSKIAKGFSNSTYLSTLRKYAGTVRTMSRSNAKEYLVSKGISKSVASGFVRYLGCSTVVFTKDFILEELASSSSRSKYSTDDGIIKIEYRTSYNGEWYSHWSTQSWNAPGIYEPSHKYAYGCFVREDS